MKSTSEARASPPRPTRAFHRKDEFIATLAHELRNPLAAASNWIGVLQRELVPNDLRDRALQGLQRQNARMQRLIEDLSDVAQVRRGEVQLDPQTVDLAKIVKLAVEDCGPSINERIHSLKLQLPDATVPVCADPERMIQVIVNLVSNADRYSPKAGDIIVTLLVDERHAVLKVRDFGIGIPSDKLSAVFNVFTRLEAAKAVYPRGLGIGLSVVKRLVELHGGTVTAHSEGAGGGSEFVVRLPLAQSEIAQESLNAGLPRDALPRQNQLKRERTPTAAFVMAGGKELRKTEWPIEPLARELRPSERPSTVHPPSVERSAERFDREV